MICGTPVMDKLLGEYSSHLINMIYGPASTGKTTACMLATIACASQGEKVLFIDTENGFSVERFSQLNPDYKTLLKNVILLRVDDFDQQVKLFKKLPSMVKNIGLLVVDTMGALYRAERTKNISEKNKQFIEQVDSLRKLYKEYDFPVIVTNQVYSTLKKDNVRPVGGDIIIRRSKCMIELKDMEGSRMAVLVKHPELERRSINFTIVKEGFKEV